MAAHDDLVENGRLHLASGTRDSIGRAGDYFRRAVTLDPDSAPAHVWLALYYWAAASEGYTMPAQKALLQAHKAAHRAIELDPGGADARAVLCAVAVHLEYDWTEGARYFAEATGGSGLSADAARLCAWGYLLPAGRPREAADHLDGLCHADPGNAANVAALGVCLHAAGDLQAAHHRYLEALRFDGANVLAHVNLAMWLLEQGQADAARAEADSAGANAGTNPSVIGCRAATRTLKGEDGNADAILALLGPSERYGAAAGLCRYHLLVGDLEAAAQWADTAIGERDATVPGALQMSAATGLRASRYWPRIAKKLRLA
jgi:Flp pilus assembly protein TadD